MRIVLCLSWALLAGSAWAQSPASGEVPLRRITSQDANLMAGAGVGASVATLLLSSALQAPVGLLVAPLASGAAVYAVGEARGTEGSLPLALAGAAVGGTAGLALLSTGFYSAYRIDAGGETLLLLFMGTAAYVVLPSVLAVVGYDLRAGARATPTGEVVPSLSLTVSL